MSKILEILAARKEAIAAPKPAPYEKMSDKIQEKLAKELESLEGIVKRFGQDTELDLLPISRKEDEIFCIEGSLLAYYCERRLQERTAEDALMAVFAQSKRMVCGKCNKLWSRCICYHNSIFSSLAHRV